MKREFLSKNLASIRWAWSKNQHNGSDLVNQVARRVSEAMIIDALHDESINEHRVIEEEVLDNNIKQSTKNVSFAKVIRLNENEFTIIWKNQKYDKIELSYPNFEEFLYENYQLDKLIFCTEYGKSNVRYRCHPSFFHNGHYNEWILVDYDTRKNFPCKLIVIIPGECNDFDGY